MGVYVKGMEMPHDCGDCDFLSGLICHDNEYYCYAPAFEKNYSINVTDNVENWSRPDWCPLVEIPIPHGDLVDKDKVYQSFYTDNQEINDAVLYAQTVIPAEGV
jgi:hypothetical protein